MSTSSALEFVPTQGELSVVAAILEHARSNSATLSSLDGVPQINSDTAVDILQRSGLSYEDLANIWSIADEDGDGNLSERELAIAVRLIGWAQSGKPVNRSFVNYCTSFASLIAAHGSPLYSQWSVANSEGRLGKQVGRWLSPCAITTCEPP